ncbi:MAG: ABC transporter permease subunit [Clostridiales bacterium]|nr:ABC transporter permease subunit [Clostridiales bacterium]
MSAVFKKEFRSGMCGMTGMIFIAYVLLFLGLYTVYVNYYYGLGNFEIIIISAAFLSLLAVPLLTMRSFSEERHNKTDQLLYSLPISTGKIVLGKFFGMAAIFAIPTAVVCIYPLIASTYNSGSINLAIGYGSILAYYFLGCAVIAICMFLSTLTESQVIAAILSIGVILLMYFSDLLLTVIPSGATISMIAAIVLAVALGCIVFAGTKNAIVGGTCGGVLIIGIVVVYIVDASLFDGLLQTIIGALSIFTPIESFGLGTFDIACLFRYLSICALFIFFTIQSFEKRRWN